MYFRVVLFALLLLAGVSHAAALPRIIAGADNPVPQCVRPAALMDFVAERNAQHNPPRTIDPRFSNIASLYQSIGRCVARQPEQCVAVRWDYAFFQMLIETNYLTFRRPNGVPASVVPTDNNFAGVGAAISGRPGEHFKDVATGVLAHLQHVLMYSTTRVPNPVAKRTRQVQDDVQHAMLRLHRPVTFGDLAREWTGTDRNTYGAEMHKLAESYSSRYCTQASRGERVVATAGSR
ncbi:MAG TPA: N-acetylmuramoyl-L-alanine amidase [Pseudolabrys sp.]|nr:N-acetylmuramoyl-L-alanine amidase [Pseudolabrys sp.]